MIIFEKLGYNKIQSLGIHDIIAEENLNYKENYDKLKYELCNNKNLIGAGNLSKDDNITIGGKSENFIFRDHKITWDKTIYSDQIHYSLNTLDKNKECLLIIIASNENNDICANIHQITIDKKCPVVGHMVKGGGSLLLTIAIEFIQSIKYKYKINIIQIKDNSVKSCVNKKIKLWLLNTLKTGLPWHINYGFEPYDTENMKLDELNKTKIMANSRILSRTKTSIIKEKNLFPMDKLLLSIYNKYENDSIIYFFKELFENHINCKYIENIQNELITNLLLFDITGISYFIYLIPKNKYK
jgi:hypothetical protein